MTTMKTFPEYELVWLTFGDKGLPWREDFSASNSGMVQHVHTGSEVSEFAWRNCHLLVREWWAANRETVGTPWVVFLEYDVLVRADLAAALGRPRPGVGVVGARVLQGVRDAHWIGFRDVEKLPEELRAGAIGITPFAVFAASREALDELIHPEWDELFAEDFLSELLPTTILASMGFRVGQAVDLPNVTTTRMAYPGDDAVGIYHPVKTR